MVTENRVLGLLGISTKAGKLVYGTDACIEAIQRRKVPLIVVAEDASERTKNNFINLCKENNVEIIIYSNIEKISKSIGKVNKAVIGIKEKNLASQIVNITNGGEN